MEGVELSVEVGVEGVELRVEVGMEGVWRRGLTDKGLVGADGVEDEVPHFPPDDQCQDNVHGTKHTHQDEAYLNSHMVS